MHGLADFALRRLRLRNPWMFKAPALMAIPYFAIAVARMPLDRAFGGVAAALCTIAGIAGIAYFLNDLADIEHDRAAGRDNAVAGLSGTRRAGLLLVLLVLALAPWAYLGLTPTTAALLVVEFVLFVLYAAPPFRLKERGAAGAIADAAYAHAVPAVLAFLTFVHLASGSYSPPALLVAAIGVWQFALGLRNIVLHQLRDYEDDAQSGTRTWAVTLGDARLRMLLRSVFVPLEIVAFALFLTTSWHEMPGIAIGFAAHGVFASTRLRVLRQPQPLTLRETMYTYFDNFYADWLPLIVIGYMVVRLPATGAIAVLHLLIFRNGIRQSTRDVKGRFQPAAA